MPPASSKSPGVASVEKVSADMIPGVDSPVVFDVASKPTGVDLGCPQADPPCVMMYLMMLSLIRHWMMVSKHMH